MNDHLDSRNDRHRELRQATGGSAIADVASDTACNGSACASPFATRMVSYTPGGPVGVGHPAAVQLAPCIYGTHFTLEQGSFR